MVEDTMPGAPDDDDNFPDAMHQVSHVVGEANTTPSHTDTTDAVTR